MMGLGDRRVRKKTVVQGEPRLLDRESVMLRRLQGASGQVTDWRWGRWGGWRFRPGCEWKVLV